MENKLFKSSYKKLHYTVAIKVYDSCCEFGVEVVEGQTPPTYHQVIGVLETQKANVIEQQAKQNRAVFKKEKKLKK